MLPPELIRRDLSFMKSFVAATRACARQQAQAVKLVMDRCDQMLESGLNGAGQSQSVESPNSANNISADASSKRRKLAAIGTKA